MGVKWFKDKCVRALLLPRRRPWLKGGGSTSDETITRNMGQRPVNTAHPKTAVHSAKLKTHFSKQAQSTAKRPFYKKTGLTNRYFHQKVNTVRPRVVNIARPNTAPVNTVRGKPQHDDKGFVDSGCSRHMTGNIAYLSDFKEFDGGYVAFGGGAYGGRITGKGTLKTDNLDFEDDETSEILKRFIKEIENLVDKKVKIIRSDNGTEFKNKVMDDFCREKGIKREYSIARTPQQNGVAERRNRTLIKAARTMLADSKLPTTFWAEAVSTACYIVGYTNYLETKWVEKNLEYGFLENKPMIEGTGPKWLFDIDSLTQSINYVPVTTGTVSNNSACTSEENNQDCIVMPIWKDISYFDSPIKNVDNSEPKTTDDAQKQVEDGLNNENAEQERFANDSNSNDVNAVGQQVNTASLYVNTGSLKLNAVGPSVSTASPNEEDNTEEEPEVYLGNITNSYIVPTTPNTRIHKDHPIVNVIDLLNGKKAIGTKWVFRNKKDKMGIVIRNKARIEAIRLFLAYASFMGFLVTQMDVKSALLYGTIEEEVYVTQPPGFKDPDHPDKVYKVVGLYGCHQAQEHDDIIFGSTNKELCTGFEKLMKDKFQMSSMGELTFFLGLQVQQKEDGIFISQDKYVAEILKKFNYSDVKSASTPIDLEKPFVKDGDADDVDVHLYRSMIGSLMYLTASRPDIMFVVCACARFQVTPKTSHLLAVKRIFRYLKGKPTLGLWYSRDSPLETQTVVATSTTEAEYVAVVGDEAVHKELGDRMERAATTASSLEAEQDSGSGPRCQDTILGDVNAQTRFEITSKQSIDPPLSRGYTLGSGEDNMKLIGIDEIFPKFAEMHNVVAFLEKPEESDGFAEIIDFLKASSVSYALTVNPLQALVDKKRVIVTELSIRRDLHLDDAEGTDCLPTATIFEELARMGYEKPSQKLTFYKAFFSLQWKYFIHTITQCLSAKSTAWNEFSSSMASLIILLATNQKFNLSKYIFDAMVKHLDGGVKFLMYPCFLQVFINQQLGNMSTHKKIFVNPFHTKKVFANMKRAGKDFSRRKNTLFDTNDKDKPSKKAQRQEAEVPQDEAEHEESVPTPSNDPQPSGEDSMQLTDLLIFCTKLQTHVLDLQKAKDAQAKEIASLKKRIQRLERRKMSRPTGESLGAPEDASKQGRSIEDIDADVDVSLVDETQERQNDDLMFDSGVLEDDVMHVEAKVDGKIKHESQVMFRVPQRTQPSKFKDNEKESKGKKEEGREEATRVEEEKESKEVDEDNEVELNKLLMIKKDEDIAIDDIPLTTKLPVIIDYKLHKEGMLVHYQLIRADGSSKRYSSMIRMLQGIDREDLEALWRIVKAKYGDTRPENEFERVFY
ncbi:putative ribonuclease H-like domain-containing protein [Tanacetum coccineum]